VRRKKGHGEAMLISTRRAIVLQSGAVFAYRIRRSSSVPVMADNGTCTIVFVLYLSLHNDNPVGIFSPL
jgi:hypothetical protein